MISIGRALTMPCVSTTATRTTSNFSSSILARTRAVFSRRSGVSRPIRAAKFGRPSEFSAALVTLMLVSGGISRYSRQCCIVRWLVHASEPAPGGCCRFRNYSGICWAASSAGPRDGSGGSDATRQPPALLLNWPGRAKPEQPLPSWRSCREGLLRGQLRPASPSFWPAARRRNRTTGAAKGTSVPMRPQRWINRAAAGPCLSVGRRWE